MHRDLHAAEVDKHVHVHVHNNYRLKLPIFAMYMYIQLYLVICNQRIQPKRLQMTIRFPHLSTHVLVISARCSELKLAFRSNNLRKLLCTSVS